MQDNIKKQYWSIKEVCDMLQVKKTTIEYWLKKFLFNIESFHFNSQKFRMIPMRDVALLHHVKRLLKEEKYTIEGAKKKLRESKLI